jgi:hypothetical protein
MTQEITTEDARELVQRAGWLLRSRPVPGADPADAQAWQQTVEEFLHSALIQQALAQTGITAVPGAPEPTDDLAAFFVALEQALGSRLDSPIAVIVATVVAGAIAGFLAGHAADA